MSLGLSGVIPRIKQNHMTQIGSSTPTYDANGNVTNDFLHVYAWDAASRPVTIDGVGVTYDALGRMVEQDKSGVYSQIVYAPSGFKLAIMSGQTLTKAFVPLSGGAVAVYNSSGLAYYRHSDHLGSSRFASTPSRTLYFDGAYAPFGEPYAQTGTTDLSFTGMNQDTVANLYDFPTREYGTQGRWPSPDPSGLASVRLTDPQTLNRYAYVRNSPLHIVDPTGLCGLDDGGGDDGGDVAFLGRQGRGRYRGFGHGYRPNECGDPGQEGTPPQEGPPDINLPPPDPGACPESLCTTPVPGPGDEFSSLQEAGAIAAIYAYYQGEITGDELTGPSFCTTTNERVYITDRPGFFVPTLGRVFGCLHPNEIAASRDFIGELVGCLLPESPVRPTLVVFPAPSLHDLLGLRQRREPMGIQAFCPKRSVERFHESIVRRFSWSGKSHSHSVLIGPQIHRLTGKLAPIVTVKKLRNSALDFNSVQRQHHIFALQPLF